MATVQIKPLLLTLKHVKPNSATLPLLTAIQGVLNKSYTKTYCSQPAIFGDTHVRIADPAQVADIIGKDGFTIVLLLSPGSSNVQDSQQYEVVATGSLKQFGSGSLDEYFTWSKNRSGSEWAAGKGRPLQAASESSAAQEDGTSEVKYEVAAFGVSPDHQSLGLGARVLQEMEWIVENLDRVNHAILEDGKFGEDVPLSSSENSPQGLATGISLDKLRGSDASVNSIGGDLVPLGEPGRTPKLVLMGIRELGNEAYYQRRGFKRVWEGPVPVGMWDCRQECTVVYMEKDLG